MDLIANVDLEELESHLYSQLYHSTEVLDESRLNLNISDSLSDGTPNKYYRYFGNQLQNSLNTLNEQTSSSPINNSENSTFPNSTVSLEVPQLNTLSTAIHHNQTNINDHHITTGHVERQLRTTTRKQKNLRRSKRLQDKTETNTSKLRQKVFLNKKLTRSGRQEENSVTIYISDSDSDDCVAVDEYMIDTRQINTKFPKKYNAEDGGLPPETDDDIIFVPPPPVEVITVDCDDASQCNVDEVSNSNVDNNKEPALIELDSSLSNDFLETANVDPNSQFNFNLHGSEFSNNEITNAQESSKTTEYCETESSCSTNEPNRSFSNTVKTIVFDEVEFPKEAIFNEKDLESFGSFIVPKRSCNKTNDSPNHINERKHEDEPLNCVDVLSTSNSSESDYETNRINKSHNLPYLSPMTTPDTTSKRYKNNANEFFKDKSSLSDKGSGESKKRKESNSSIRKKKRDSLNETVNIDFGISCITSTPNVPTSTKKKKHSCPTTSDEYDCSTLQISDSFLDHATIIQPDLNVSDNDLINAQKPKKKKKKTSSISTTSVFNTETSEVYEITEHLVEADEPCDVESGNVERIKTKRKKSNSSSKMTECYDKNIEINPDPRAFVEQDVSETVDNNEDVGNKERSKKRKKKRKSSSENHSETVEYTSDVNRGEENVTDTETTCYSTVVELTKPKKKKKREVALSDHLEVSGSEHEEGIKDLQDRNVHGKLGLKQKKKLKESALSRSIENAPTEQKTSKTLDDIDYNDRDEGITHSQNKNIHEKEKLKKKSKETNVSNTLLGDIDKQTISSKKLKNNDVSTHTESESKQKKKKRELIVELPSLDPIVENLVDMSTTVIKQKKKRKDTSLSEDIPLNVNERNEELNIIKESTTTTQNIEMLLPEVIETNTLENNDASSTRTDSEVKQKKRKKELIVELHSHEPIIENLSVILKQKKKRRDISISEDISLNANERNEELNSTKEMPTITQNNEMLLPEVIETNTLENNDAPSTRTDSEVKQKKRKKELNVELHSQEPVIENLVDMSTTVILKQKKKRGDISASEVTKLNTGQEHEELNISKENRTRTEDTVSEILETSFLPNALEVKEHISNSEVDSNGHNITATNETCVLSEEEDIVVVKPTNAMLDTGNVLQVELSNASDALNDNDLIVISNEDEEPRKDQQSGFQKPCVNEGDKVIFIDLDDSDISSCETVSSKSDTDSDFEVLDDNDHDLALNVSTENTSEKTLNVEENTDKIIREARLPMRDYDNYSVELVKSKQSNDPQKWMILATDKFSYLNQKKIGPRCHRCRHFGHTGDRCPDKPNPPPCILCGKPDHRETRCPNRLCLQCGNTEVANTSIYCTRCFKYREVMCKLCKMKGHLEKFCPDLWRRYYLTTNEGPMIVSHAPTKPRNDQWCSGCAQQGHLEHECNQNIRSFPPTTAYIMSYEDVLGHNEEIRSQEYDRNTAGTSTTSDAGNQFANEPANYVNSEHSKIPSLLNLPVALPDLNNFNSPNVTIRVSNEPTNVPCKEIIFQMRLNFDNQVNRNSQFKYPDDDKDLDVKAVKHLIMTMPSHVVINFLQKEMDILDNCNIDPRLLRRKIHKLDRLLDSKKKLPKKVLHEKNFWYKLLNMFVFGIYKYKDGNLHINYLRRFLSQAKNFKLDRNKRTALFSSYNYIFGCNRHLNVNYFKIIRLLIRKHRR